MVAGLDDKSRRMMAEAESRARDRDLTELERELEASFVADLGTDHEEIKTAVLGPESAPTVQMPIDVNAATSRIKRDADVATAEAERDTAIRRAQAMREAAIAKANSDQERVLAETLSLAKQSESQRDLEHELLRRNDARLVGARPALVKS